MRLILPATTRLIGFDEELELGAFIPGRVVPVAVVKDGESVFSTLVAMPGPEPLREVIEVQLFSGQKIRLPRRTVVLLDGGDSGEFVEALSLPRPATIADWKATQDHEVERQWHSQTQTIKVKGKPLHGGANLRSWSNGVVEIVRDIVTVELAQPCPTIVVEVDADALAVIGHRPGGDPDGILIRENF